MQRRDLPVLELDQPVQVPDVFLGVGEALLVLVVLAPQGVDLLPRESQAPATRPGSRVVVLRRSTPGRVRGHELDATAGHRFGFRRRRSRRGGRRRCAAACAALLPLHSLAAHFGDRRTVVDSDLLPGGDAQDCAGVQRVDVPGCERFRVHAGGGETWRHPAVVSLQVRELENELETFLFDRSVSGIELTRAGQRFFELAGPLVRGADELSIASTDQFDEAKREHLQLAASVAGAAHVLPRFVVRYRNLYPNVRLTVRNGPLRQGLELLLGDEVEFTLGPKDFYREDLLQYREIRTYEIVLITSLDHPLAGRESVSPEEASAWPAIVPPAGTYSRQFGENAARQFGVDIKAAIEVGGWGVIKRYVEAGLGISIVPSIAVTEADRLAVIPLRGYFQRRSFGVFTRRGEYLTPPARIFLHLMIPDFPDPLAPPS